MALCLTGTASQAWGQANTLWVDSAVGTPGNGQQATPYKSLSWAFQDPNLLPGWTVMVAGNGLSAPYRNTAGAGSDSTEVFPITVPAGVRIQYWDKFNLLPNVRPASAVFIPGDTTSPTCFLLEGGNTSVPQGISAYLQTAMTPIPDLNQGLEIREFRRAFLIQHNSNYLTLNVVLDGVASYECQEALDVIKSVVGPFTVLVKRSVFRGPSGIPFPPTAQVVEVNLQTAALSGSVSPLVELRNCDLRPSGANLRSSMVTVLNNGGADDYLQVQLKSCHISGQPLVPPIPPNPAHRIQGACVEAVWEGEARGKVTIQDSVLWDAEGDGVLGSVQSSTGAQGEIEILGCDVAYHGAATFAITPVIAVASFSASGVHLAAIEKGDWLDVEFRTTEARDNRKHGAFLELASFPDENDAFHNVDVEYCNFSRNGLPLDSSSDGHGFYVALKEATINLEMHRSLLARNHTTGFTAFLREGDTLRHQVIAVTNTVISANEGKSGGDPGFHPWYLPRHVAPFTVMSEYGDHSATVNLSHVTFTDNESPYAVSMFEWDDPSYGFNYQQLWSGASSVDNSVLKKNHWVAPPVQDQAYYPEPPDPNNPPPGGHLWIRMFDSTSESNLGKQSPAYSSAYAPVNGNFYEDPLLVAFTWMNTALGLVFPGTSGGILSPLVDNGGSPVFAGETTDVRGPGYPRVVDFGNNGSPVRDVGAFEVQN